MKHFLWLSFWLAVVSLSTLNEPQPISAFTPGSDQTEATPILIFEHDRTVTGITPSVTVNGAIWSPDDTRILSWSGDGTVRVWDAQTGHEIRRFDVLGNGMWLLNGSYIMTNDFNASEVTLWEADNGTALYRLTSFSSLATDFSPDQTLFMWFTTDGYEFRDTRTGNRLFEIPKETYHSFNWLDNERVLLFTQRGQVEIWDLQRQMLISSFLVEGQYLAHTGNRLLTASRYMGMTSAYLYDMERGLGLMIYQTTSQEVLFSLMPDGKQLVINERESPLADDRLMILDITSREITHEIKSPPLKSNILNYQFSGDLSKLFISSFPDMNTENLFGSFPERGIVWDMNADELILEIPYAVSYGEWSPGGAYLAVYGNIGGGVWDGSSNTELFHIHNDEYVRDVAWSHDGTRFLSWREHRLYVWAVGEG